MREKVRVGVVGVGSLGQHHARIYRELDEVEFVGLFDPDRARAAEIAAANHARAFDCLEDLAAEIDAASVVVPTHLHREVAGGLLGQGLHLLVEKPIASTTREAEELVAMAQERNLILQVGHVERFNPVQGTLEQYTGRPRFIEAHRLAPFPPPREGQMPRGTEVSVVLDLMIHDIEVLLHLVDAKVVDFHAVGIPVLSPSEDIANVRLQFENGCVANVTASRISPEQMRKIRVFYDDAYISLDYQAQEGELHRKTAEGIVREQIPIEKGDALTNELKAFAECVRHHSQPKVSGEHGAEALRLAVAITQKVRVSSS